MTLSCHGLKLTLWPLTEKASRVAQSLPFSSSALHLTSYPTGNSGMLQCLCVLFIQDKVLFSWVIYWCGLDSTRIWYQERERKTQKKNHPNFFSLCILLFFSHNIDSLFWMWFIRACSLIHHYNLCTAYHKISRLLGVQYTDWNCARLPSPGLLFDFFCNERRWRINKS